MQVEPTPLTVQPPHLFNVQRSRLFGSVFVVNDTIATRRESPLSRVTDPDFAINDRFETVAPYHFPSVRVLNVREAASIGRPRFSQFASVGVLRIGDLLKFDPLAKSHG
jgi:hypothetical protein